MKKTSYSPISRSAFDAAGPSVDTVTVFSTLTFEVGLVVGVLDGAMKKMKIYLLMFNNKNMLGGVPLDRSRN